MSNTVFHVILWTENATNVTFTIAGMATYASRSDADRVVDAYRESLLVGYINNGTAEEAYHSRVGVLEIPKADPRLNHPEPYTSEEADKFIEDLRARMTKSRSEA